MGDRTSQRGSTAIQPQREGPDMRPADTGATSSGPTSAYGSGMGTDTPTEEVVPKTLDVIDKGIVSEGVARELYGMYDSCLLDIESTNL